jgi:hypothetical protein
LFALTGVGRPADSFGGVESDVFGFWESTRGGGQDFTGVGMGMGTDSGIMDSFHEILSTIEDI